MSVERALLAAIRAHASADAAVKTALGDPARLYDNHPADPAFPFVTIGSVDTRPADSADAPALAHTITLHVWSRQGGKADALAALAALRASLHLGQLTLAGARLVLLRAVASHVGNAGDARAIEGVLTLEAITEPD
jgi:hypothetical protein